MSPDGTLVVLERGERCPNSRLVETTTGVEILDFGPSYLLNAVFNPEGHFPGGRYLATSTDGILEIYDVENATLVARSTGWTLSLAFDPSGRYLALGHDMGRVRVLDMEQIARGTTPDEAGVFDQMGLSDEVFGVAMNDTGLLATSTHNSLKLWDLDSGELIAEPLVEIDTPPFAAFSPDGSYMAYVDSGYVLRKWFLDPRPLLDYARTRVTRDLTPEECVRYVGPGGCPST